MKTRPLSEVLKDNRRVAAAIKAGQLQTINRERSPWTYLAAFAALMLGAVLLGGVVNALKPVGVHRDRTPQMNDGGYK